MARSSTHAVVAPGQVFVMGDNRDNAFDSRYAGTVPSENLNARALRVVYSGGDSAVWRKPRLGHEVHGALLVPASMDEALLRCQPEREHGSQQGPPTRFTREVATWILSRARRQPPRTPLGDIRSTGW